MADIDAALILEISREVAKLIGFLVDRGVDPRAAIAVLEASAELIREQNDLGAELSPALESVTVKEHAGMWVTVERFADGTSRSRRHPNEIEAEFHKLDLLAH